MFLISEGSEFHNLGAAIVNDLSPIVAADFFSGGVNNIEIVRPKTIFSVLSDMHETGYLRRCHVVQCFKSNQDDLKLYSVGDKQPVQFF